MIKKITFCISLFGNFWIWRLYHQNLWIFILLILASTVLLQYFQKKSKLYLVILSLLLFVLSIVQIQTTQIHSLTKLSNDETRVFDARVNLYKSDFHPIRLLFYKLPLARFLEGDFHTITFRVQRNFFETIDPNVYFFGGHPRERLWANEFEKFPYFLIIPFFIGIYIFLLRKETLLVILSLSALLIVSLIGHQNKNGPFLFLPFLILFTYLGILQLINFMRPNYGK